MEIGPQYHGTCPWRSGAWVGSCCARSLGRALKDFYVRLARTAAMAYSLPVSHCLSCTQQLVSLPEKLVPVPGTECALYPRDVCRIHRVPLQAWPFATPSPPSSPACRPWPLATPSRTMSSLILRRPWLLAAPSPAVLYFYRPWPPATPSTIENRPGVPPAACHSSAS